MANKQTVIESNDCENYHQQVEQENSNVTEDEQGTPTKSAYGPDANHRSA